MPRIKKTAPAPTRQTGQRSVEPYLQRIIPQWNRPDWLTGKAWRKIVEMQPTALACRDTMNANISNLEWAIEARDSTQRDELKPEIQYYTKLIEHGGELDYVGTVEWLGKDAQDLPFGGAAEIIREGDVPDGKVRWIIPLDGATCYPTDNYKFPIGQRYLSDEVYFPDHAIDRIYISPRPEIDRKGWGMAPPEKIYMALVMLARGDTYYSSLLSDTPQVGILDLIDMSKDSAEEWVKAWQSLLGGIDPFKIPVLYEHEKKAEFISFTKSPTELMFDKALSKYVILTCAGYGMSTSDIGLPSTSSGGETLAGSIRQERRTRRTGYALMKKKWVAFWNKILPENLQFKFIDLDDEVSVAMGRARLASATAFNILLTSKVLTPNEVRAQMIADGLMTITMPETIDGGDQPVETAPKGNNTNSNMLGKPISPSQGGYGEVKSIIQEEQDLLTIDKETETMLQNSDIMLETTNLEEENNGN